MRRLYRSRKNRMILGVCGGLAEHLDMDPSMVRLLTVFLCIFTGLLPIALVYLIAAFIIPEKS